MNVTVVEERKEKRRFTFAEIEVGEYFYFLNSRKEKVVFQKLSDNQVLKLFDEPNYYIKTNIINTNSWTCDRVYYKPVDVRIEVVI